MDKAPDSTAEVHKSPETPQTESHSHEGVHKKSQARLFLLIGAVVLLAIGGIWWYMQNQTARTTIEPRDIKIGALNPISGIYTTVGTSIKEGIEFAAREHAAEGLNVTFIYKDTACDGPKAVQAVKDLAAEGVVAIIGDLCSGSTLEAVPVAAELKIPMVSATSTNPKLTGFSPYFSRVIPSDAFSSEFTADLLYNKHKITKLAIIHSNDAYGNSLNEAVSAAFKNLGGTVVDSQKFANEATNVTTQVTHIKAASPDAVYIVTSSSVTWIAIMQKMKDLRLTVPVYASESLKDVAFIKQAGTLAEGMYIIAVSEGSSAYVEKHNGAFGKDPDLYNAQAYDASRAVIEALNTGAVTGEELRDAIRKVSFEGASGKIQFDIQGDVAPNFSVYKVVDGKFRAEE